MICILEMKVLDSNYCAIGVNTVVKLYLSVIARKICETSWIDHEIALVFQSEQHDPFKTIKHCTWVIRKTLEITYMRHITCKIEFRFSFTLCSLEPVYEYLREFPVINENLSFCVKCLYFLSDFSLFGDESQHINIKTEKVMFRFLV